MNNGGGFSSAMEWSIGEGVSIIPFSAGGITLNTGVLQPLSNVVTGIFEFGPAVFGNQITVGPNPVIHSLYIKTRLNQIGSLSIQLLDAKLAVLHSIEAGTIYSSYDNVMAMQAYPDGVFYVRVYFKPMNNVPKTGIYKIIKLSN